MIFEAEEVRDETYKGFTSTHCAAIELYLDNRDALCEYGYPIDINFKNFGTQDGRIVIRADGMVVFYPDGGTYRILLEGKS